MKRRICRAFLAAMMLAAVQAFAQPAAVVEGVQMPAWVERAGVRAPITPGMLLQPGDILHTGSDSRLLVRLSEGSLVKLGENGSLRFTEISATRKMLRAALGVLKGAFRFTTDVAMRSRQREVSVAIGTITAGIRGTDFWGRSRPDTDLQVVCLIEGAVAVEAPGEAPVVLDQPPGTPRKSARSSKASSSPTSFASPTSPPAPTRERSKASCAASSRSGGCRG